MSWVRAVAVVFLWTILPGTGWGADLQLGLAGSAEYDDNVLRSPSNKEDDFVFRITPKVSFIEDEGKFHWDLRYWVPWEKAIETDRIDGFRHFVSADARRYVGQRTQVFFKDVFSYSESVTSFSVFDESGAPTVGTERTPVYRNSATLGVQHGFTPRLTGNLAFSHRLFESDVARRSDNMVYVGNTNLHYALSSQHRLGGGAAATYQDLEASNDGSIAPSQAFFLNIYGSWVWTIDETTLFELTGGPTFVKNEQDAPAYELSGQPVIPYAQSRGAFYIYDFNNCDQVNSQWVLSGCSPLLLVPDADDQETIRSATTTLSFVDDTGIGGSSSNWTFFGEAALTKRWSPRLLSRLMYRRTESTASGTASATLDLVSLSTSWQISELWDVGLRADFTRRESTAPTRETLLVVQEANFGAADPLSAFNGSAESIGFTSRKVNRALDTNRWGVSARMTRRLTKHIRASLRYSYNEQDSKSDTAGSDSDFSNHLVTLGVQYDFDRWHLW
jgi:hypothetical protein